MSLHHIPAQPNEAPAPPNEAPRFIASTNIDVERAYEGLSSVEELLCIADPSGANLLQYATEIFYRGGLRDSIGSGGDRAIRALESVIMLKQTCVTVRSIAHGMQGLASQDTTASSGPKSKIIDEIVNLVSFSEDELNQAIRTRHMFTIRETATSRRAKDFLSKINLRTFVPRSEFEVAPLVKEFFELHGGHGEGLHRCATDETTRRMELYNLKCGGVMLSCMMECIGCRRECHTKMLSLAASIKEVADRPVAAFSEDELILASVVNKKVLANEIKATMDSGLRFLEYFCRQFEEKYPSTLEKFGGGEKQEKDKENQDQNASTNEE